MSFDLVSSLDRLFLVSIDLAKVHFVLLAERVGRLLEGRLQHARRCVSSKAQRRARHNLFARRTLS